MAKAFPGTVGPVVDAARAQALAQCSNPQDVPSAALRLWVSSTLGTDVLPEVFGRLPTQLQITTAYYPGSAVRQQDQMDLLASMLSRAQVTREVAIHTAKALV
jgi:hypothetical protein